MNNCEKDDKRQNEALTSVTEELNALKNTVLSMVENQAESVRNDSVSVTSAVVDGNNFPNLAFLTQEAADSYFSYANPKFQAQRLVK